MFSTLDLIIALHRIPVAEEDIPKIVITKPFNMYEFIYMSFGSRNAAQTFQRFIDSVLEGLNFCYAYINNILAASLSPEEHYEHFKILLRRLEKYSVVINPIKCIFDLEEVKFLGYLISKEGIRSISGRIKAIIEYQKPQTVKDLRRYLGMLNFYWRFLPDIAKILATISKLLHGNI